MLVLLLIIILLLLLLNDVSSFSITNNNKYNHYNTKITMFIDDHLPLTSTFLINDQIPLTSLSSIVFEKAINGGKSGALAGVLQVLSLMWLRTTLNYQYRYGTTTLDALQTLYKEGGISRLYQGLPFALLQGPLSRFGDTAANTLIVTVIDLTSTQMPRYISTLGASALAGGWRILLMPIDTVKTSMQVNGETGISIIQERIKEKGISTLYAGAVATLAATVVGHYPWFLTYNTLSDILPTANDIITHTNNNNDNNDLLYNQLAMLDPRLITLLRSAFIGLVAGSVSDICSNSLRVLKTTRQTDIELTSYIDSAKNIISKEGFIGLFGRGLQTRLLANSIQSILFSVLFKFFNQQSK